MKKALIVFVVLINRTGQLQEVDIAWHELGFAQDAYVVRDLWTRTDLGSVNGQFTRTIESHGVFVARISECRI